MPTEKEKIKIKELAAAGKSVNTIKNNLDLPKSTVYYHFKKEVGQKQKDYAPEIPNDEDFRGELCGIFAGDGSYQITKRTTYKTKFHLNAQEEYYRILKKFLDRKTGKEPFQHIVEKDNCAILFYCYKRFLELYKENLHWGDDKTKSIGLKSDKFYSKEFEKAFLRGLIDTDGSLHHNRYVFTTISSNLSSDIEEILKKNSIDHKTSKYIDKRPNHRPVYNTYVSKKETESLFNLVKPRNPKKRI